MAGRRQALHLFASLSGVAVLVVVLRWLHVTNATTVALALLVVVLATATTSRLWVAVICSAVAMLALNFFFMPPVGTFTIADAQNWVALLVFLIVGFVASHLSSSAQARTRDAIERRQELGHLFDLSRDVLLTTERPDTLDALVTYIARRFELAGVALCLPAEGGAWQLRQGGSDEIRLAEPVLEQARTRAGATLEFDARERTYGGHAIVADTSGRSVVLVPLRLGVRVIGLLAAREGRLEAGTLDAIAGLVAIAVERTQLLASRTEAELMRQQADLASTLLASLSHDLRTPLTAIGVAVENLQKAALTPDQRNEQGQLALVELERLKRLFRDILDMARIDTNALTVERDWLTPADLIDAAVSSLRPTLAHRALVIDADASTVVCVDPRLTSAALSHLIENAAQYSPADRSIDVRGFTGPEGLHVEVRDRGPGLDPEELDHLFERFFRGRAASQQPLGTGMGLAIARGLLAAEGGRVWGENAAGGGARFTLVVPGDSHAAATAPET
jgi:two-component system, OmpR family, sensor histidine kinase KdpD